MKLPPISYLLQGALETTRRKHVHSTRTNRPYTYTINLRVHTRTLTRTCTRTVPQAYTRYLVVPYIDGYFFRVGGIPPVDVNAPGGIRLGDFPRCLTLLVLHPRSFVPDTKASATKMGGGRAAYTSARSARHAR